VSGGGFPVVIVGGGIAGLACAVALGRAGHRVVVAEKRADAAEAGAGLQLSPNASHILLNWGLGAELGRVAVAPVKLAIRRWGEPRAYAEMPFDRAADGAPFWVMLRADLHAALLGTARGLPNVTFREGLAFESMVREADHLRLRFAGGEDIRCHAAIGADGQWSAMRKALGDSRSLDPPAWEAWRTLIPAEQTPDFIRAAVTNLWLGRDSHAVHYPVAAGKRINLVVIRRSRADEPGWDRTGDAAQLLPLAAAAAQPLRELMALAPAWSVWTVRDRIPAVRLVQGAAGLAGDAAHPILPFLAQGAALAIEDAAVLAACLPPPEALTSQTAAAGLARYAVERSRRVHRVFEAARSNASAYHLPAPLAWFRDRRMASLGPDGMRERYSWLYGWRSGGPGG
jgi:salicylate hydroxylase